MNLLKKITLALSMTISMVCTAEPRGAFVDEVFLLVQNALNSGENVQVEEALDAQIAPRLLAYVMGRLDDADNRLLAGFREEEGPADANDTALSDDEMNWRIGYLENHRQTLRVQVNPPRPPKPLLMFLTENHPLNLPVMPADELVDNWVAIADEIAAAA